ncbi:hypothetical protein GQ53DRAFT_433402 [Thozetella sp. PMI_491]|nr:hypothetical protein GQ53DRAFT_433402 [Thozetella sp. PMI_491]
MAADLKDRTALITGGGSGIGLEFAQVLYAAGCKVLLADLALHPRASQWIKSLPDHGKGSIAFQKQM